MRPKSVGAAQEHPRAAQESFRDRPGSPKEAQEAPKSHSRAPRRGVTSLGPKMRAVLCLYAMHLALVMRDMHVMHFMHTCSN